MAVRAPVPLLAFVVAAFVIPMVAFPVAAQEHEHGALGTSVVIAHDSPASGRQYVGGLAHFGVLDLGDDLVPDFHQQNHVRVTQGGLVVFETTADSGHDYDGVNSFDIAFPNIGPYMVETLGDDGKVLSMFMGNVSAPANPVEAHVEWSLPANSQARSPSMFEYSIKGANGSIIPHSDALFEVRQAGTLLFRTHTHTHTDAQELTYMFPAAGDYEVRVTGYLAFASGKGKEFQQVQATAVVNVSPVGVDLPEPAPLIASAPVPSPAAMNAVVTASGGANCTLIGTFDPYTQVGPHTQQRLEILVMETKGRATMQHVDFDARLVGPLGTVFESSSLHEYDGILEVVTRQQFPGTYTLVADVSRDEGCGGHIEMSYDVVPGGAAASGGALFIKLNVQPNLMAGTPAQFDIFAHDVAGNPFAHCEVDLQWLDARGRIVLATKLHTHEDGHFVFTASPPAGDSLMRLAPSALDAGVVPVIYAYSIGTIGGRLDFPLNAAPSLTNATDQLNAGNLPLQAEVVPGFTAPLVLLAIVGAAAFAVRRARGFQ